MRLNLCQCMCHEMMGGGMHPGQRCVCNGGTGFDDMSGHVYVWAGSTGQNESGKMEV